MLECLGLTKQPQWMLFGASCIFHAMYANKPKAAGAGQALLPVVQTHDVPRKPHKWLHKGGKAAGGEETLATHFTILQMAPNMQKEKLQRKPLPASAAWLTGDLSTPAQHMMVLYLDATSLPPPHHR